MSWLKFDTKTPEKPEVLAITIAMGWDDPDLTVGKLLKVWRWFDEHTIDGNASGVTLPLLDRLLGVTGMLSAMQVVGWLVVSDDGVSLPNFSRHNGKTAKDRALTAKRVAEHKGRATSNAEGNARIVSASLPREEKRREEKRRSKNTMVAAADAASTEPVTASPLTAKDLQAHGIDPQHAADWLALRKAKRLPLTPTAWADTVAEGVKAGLTPAQTVGKAVANNWAGFKASWLIERHSGGGAATVNKQEALEARNAAVGLEWLKSMEAQDAAQ